MKASNLRLVVTAAMKASNLRLVVTAELRMIDAINRDCWARISQGS
jgi:hypothetical protein